MQVDQIVRARLDSGNSESDESLVDGGVGDACDSDESGVDGAKVVSGGVNGNASPPSGVLGVISIGLSTNIGLVTNIVSRTTGRGGNGGVFGTLMRYSARFAAMKLRSLAGVMVLAGLPACG